jgi:hypothetical protein
MLSSNIAFVWIMENNFGILIGKMPEACLLKRIISTLSSPNLEDPHSHLLSIQILFGSCVTAFAWC